MLSETNSVPGFSGDGYSIVMDYDFTQYRLAIGFGEENRVVLFSLPKKPAQATLSVDNPAPQSGAVVNFTVQITTPEGAPEDALDNIPGGTVRFMQGNRFLGAVAVDAQGAAQFSWEPDATGDFQVVAEYSGDVDFQPASSNPQTIEIEIDIEEPEEDSLIFLPVVRK